MGNMLYSVLGADYCAKKVLESRADVAGNVTAKVSCVKSKLKKLSCELLEAKTLLFELFFAFT
jgi:hypothetical protein